MQRDPTGQNAPDSKLAVIEGPTFFGGASDVCCDNKWFLSRERGKAGDIGVIIKRAPTNCSEFCIAICSDNGNYISFLSIYSIYLPYLVILPIFSSIYSIYLFHSIISSIHSICLFHLLISSVYSIYLSIYKFYLCVYQSMNSIYLSIYLSIYEFYLCVYQSMNFI